ncbi:MAG: hypothetical protein RL220_1971 [Bacteroidota bacterium]|jgi:gliding motility-associated-like protein
MSLTSKYLNVALGLLCAVSVQAQLVNQSFETCSTLPSTTGQWQLVPGWTNAGSSTASPDYYHYLGSVQADLPETPMAIVEAAGGQAIMGMIMCGTDHSNVREYLSAEFSAPLEAGRQYHAGFKMCNGYITPVSTAGIGVSDIGVLFSVDAPVQFGQNPIGSVPQFKIDTVFYSRDWVNINFTFTADQPYEYLTVGLFGGDNDKEFEIREGNNPQYGYYFLDDFHLEIVPENYDPTLPDPDKGGQEPPAENPGGSDDLTSLPDQFFIPNTFTPNGDGSNDVFCPVSSKIEHFEMDIFNRWGDRIFHSTSASHGWDGSFNSQLAEQGAYVWAITYIVMDDEGKPEEKELSGIVNLVR